MQEEPENMGAWEFVRPLLEELVGARRLARARAAAQLEPGGRIGRAARAATRSAWSRRRSTRKPVARRRDVGDVRPLSHRESSDDHMSVNIVVPELGESIVDARVARWLKKEGDAVAVGEPLVELETEKIDLEVAAPQAGVLERASRTPKAPT